MIRSFAIFTCVLGGLLSLSTAFPAQAQDDDGGAMLDAKTQWQLADTAWGRREYDDAAALMNAFAEANPDDPNALEALWRAYYVYLVYRANPERRKIQFEKASALNIRMARRFAGNNKDRAATALWYQSQLLAHEGQRSQAIVTLEDLVRKYPDSVKEMDARWTLAEWLREAKRLREALPHYAAHRKVAGLSEWAVVSWYREGNIYEELKDKARAVEAYRAALQKPYNFAGWYSGNGTIDTARRLKALGEDELMRAYALKVLDKVPAWGDIHDQARALLGEQAAKRIYVYPYVQYAYTTDRVNIDGQSKLNLVRDIPITVRLSYVTKTDPFKGTLTILQKSEMSKMPENATKTDQGGRNLFTSEIAAPDEKGNITTDWNYKFTETERSESPPDNLVVTRKWTPAGNGWGECNIRIQSSARWYIYITLPNNKTNPNNITGRIGDQPAIQPNDILDGGRTFRWYDYYDLNQGMNIKFPAEVGGNTEQFYPQIRLERYAGNRYPDKAAVGTEAALDMKELNVKLQSAAAFPYTVSSVGYTNVTLQEVVR